jgi:hypothetical protein
MTLVNILDNLKIWCEENICREIKLKLPNDTTITSEVEYVTPAAFALYVPAKDRLPPNVPAPIPSLCVQLMEGEDRPVGHKRILTVRICLACWNPGLQSRDMLLPHVDSDRPLSVFYTQGDTAQYYTRNFDGWRDVWNFADAALRAVEGAGIMAGLRVVKEEGVKYGPFVEDGAIWDYYPYWHSWISFKIEGGLVTAPDYQDLL